MTDEDVKDVGYRPAYCIRCGRPPVMWTPGSFLHGYYCGDHIPVGFDGKIPEELRLENEVLS